jgi:hypothetical protein
VKSVFFDIQDIVEDIESTGQKTKYKKRPGGFQEKANLKDFLGKNRGGENKQIFGPLGRAERFNQISNLQTAVPFIARALSKSYPIFHEI